MEAPLGGIHLGRPRGGEGGSQPKDDSLYISYLEQRGKTADKGEGSVFGRKSWKSFMEGPLGDC